MIAPTQAGQLDLFVAYLTDVPLRDERDLMERPFFSLAKSKRTTPIAYQVGDLFVRVTAPAEIGIATIYDADVLIWAASQITDAKNRGVPHSPKIRFMPYDLLRAIHRDVGGKDYAALRAALRRLTATTIETNVAVPEGKRAAMFHWIERHDVEMDHAGNVRGMTIELPSWLYDGICAGRVLSIVPEYFEIKGGLERWLYRVVRKHAGNQPAGWAFTVDQLHTKSGTTQRRSDFARDLRRIAKDNRLPEYSVEMFTGARGDQCLRAVRRTLLPFDDPDRDADLTKVGGKRRIYQGRA